MPATGYNLKQFIFVYEIEFDPVRWLSYILLIILREIKPENKTSSKQYLHVVWCAVFLATYSLANASSPKARFWELKAHAGSSQELRSNSQLKKRASRGLVERFRCGVKWLPLVWLPFKAVQVEYRCGITLRALGAAIKGA